MANMQAYPLKEKFLNAYNQPIQPFNLVYIRVFICLFFIWKMLSRDYAFFATIPDGVFYFYPIQIYNEYMQLTGLPIISELINFHWLHWLFGYPDSLVLNLLQYGVLGSLGLYALWGGRVLGVINFCILTYLWGFVYLMGQEIDSVFLYFGVLLCLILGDHCDKPIWQVQRSDIVAKDMRAGRTFSAIILIFVLYYFPSGVNKLSDLNPLDWFRYDLIEEIEVIMTRGEIGFMSQPPAIFQHLQGQYWLNMLVVPLTYVSHLAAPLIFFRRGFIYEFSVFYFGFHFMVMGVAIAFTGYLLVWLLLYNLSAILTFTVFRNYQARAA